MREVTSRAVSVYVIAYDIRDDRRRARVAALLSRYARRVQFSVFSAYMSLADVSLLNRELSSAIDRSVDQVLMVCLGPEKEARDRVTEMGSVDVEFFEPDIWLL